MNYYSLWVSIHDLGQTLILIKKIDKTQEEVIIFKKNKRETLSHPNTRGPDAVNWEREALH